MKALFDLSGKVCLVTGGNNGIGLGMAEGLAAHGATVVIWGTNVERNAQAAEKLSVYGGIVRDARVDVTNEDAVKSAMDDIISDFGRIDQAIANAGISLAAPDVFSISAADFNKVMDVNVNGVFYTLREAARHMIARSKAGEPGGSLAGVASTAAIMGAARNEHYAASKGAVVTMLRAMAVEFGPHKISVNSILPGWTRSGMTEGHQKWQKFTDNVISRVPTGDWLDGSDFAAIAVYLASDMTRHHTGDEILIDGGYTKF